MPKYLYLGSYTAEGVKGLLREGGSGRQEAVRRLVESGGGTLEAFYFAVGEDDFVIVVDFPDFVSSLGCTLLVNASGTVRTRTVTLLTPEEVDAATKLSPDYRPPGA